MKLSQRANEMLDTVNDTAKEAVKAIAIFYAVRDGDEEANAMAMDSAIHAFKTIKEWSTI